MHPGKRRKLDGLPSTLFKPFRSPMRIDGKAQNLQTNHKEQVVTDRTATLIDHNVNCSASVSEVKHKSPHPSTEDAAPPLNSSSPIRKGPPLPSPSPRGRAGDPEYLTLQKQHSALILQLSKLSQALDTAQQALQVQSSNTDAELEALIMKWQLVSREAAEELFTSAKDRVNRMGGVGAWRERTKNQTQGWDEEEPINEDDLTDEQRDLIEGQKQEMEAENQRYGLGPVEEWVDEKDDETFTMEMMLRSLNVELDLIGYDKQGQRWKD